MPPPLNGLRVWLVSQAILLCFLRTKAYGQEVTPDGSTTTPNPGSCVTFCTISGGTTDRTGTNLFHSFTEFSVPTNGTVIFNHDPTIQNIFTRVTGANRSAIDGILRTNGTSEANLFLLNPNGIFFGPNSSLDISGSFVVTTADAIQFGNQGIFDTQNPDNNLATLTVDPSAFIFSQTTTQPIISQSAGLDPLFFFPVGLSVQDEKSLILLGGDVLIEASENFFLSGGVLTAPSGQIELGGIQGTGTVDLLINRNNFSLSYEPDTALADILIDNGTLNTSSIFGGRAGNVTINGNNVSLTNSSGIPSDTFTQDNAGNILINANSSLQLSNSSISSVTGAAGDGGSITIITDFLSLDATSALNTVTFGPGDAGNIKVQAETVLLDESNIFSSAQGFFGGFGDVGDVGSIDIETNTLTLDNSSRLDTLTDGEATDTQTIGIIAINATGLVTLGGDSVITSETLGERNASNITINAVELILQDSSSISASANEVATGSGGTINITADRLNTTSEASISASSTGASSAGDIILQINERLAVQDGAEITVSGTGTGNSGTLNIISDLISLNNGNILAAVAAGEEGNINLDIGNALVLRNDSLISAAATNAANGGNVNIASPFIIALSPGSDGSDILASAQAGNGGFITIQANTLFNIAATTTPDPRGNNINDINATSGTGINGEVIITTLQVDPDEGTLRLAPTPGESKISQGCQAGGDINGEFVASGNGGTRPSPYDLLSNNGIQEDILPPGQTIAQPTNNLLTEATNWRKNTQGQVELIPETTYHSACQHTFTGGAS